MKGLWFEDKPAPVHPNCKCEIEKFQALKVTGRSDAIIVPPDVDIPANLAEARRIRKICEPFVFRYSALLQNASFSLKCLWVLLHFAPGCKYDFKKDGHPEYEDFGNYHYGLYLKELGLNPSIAKIGAGVAQLLSGNFKLSYWRTWFDDPRDNKMIKRGYE